MWIQVHHQERLVKTEGEHNQGYLMEWASSAFWSVLWHLSTKYALLLILKLLISKCLRFQRSRTKNPLCEMLGQWNDRTKAGDIFTHFPECQIISHKGHPPVLKTRPTPHTKRPKCHWLWEVLLGCHHLEQKIVLYQQQFCATVHNNLNLSCQRLKTIPETTADINKHTGFVFFFFFLDISWKDI